jgi:4,4'-diaponeurosporenoate glycosyltransferase
MAIEAIVLRGLRSHDTIQGVPPRRVLLEVGLPLAAGAWLLGSGRRLERPAGSGVNRIPLSVVIPARNEAAPLPALLASLRTQTLLPDEVIVVDDHSSDATAAKAAGAGATVISPPPLPAGWLGKSWACHHGAAAASGELLLFLDADVVLDPPALAALVARHGAAGGMISVQPEHRPVAAYEQLSAVCNIVSLMGTGAFTARPLRPPDMAFGPCLLVGRGDYDRIGGHAHPAVRLQVAEDIAMARQLRAAGGSVTLRSGGDLVGFRMYPGGRRQLVEGWTKMIGNGGRLTWWPLQLLIGVWVTGALLGARRGLAAFRLLTGRGGRRRAAGDLAVYAAWVAEMAWLMRRVGRWHRLTPVLFPAPLAAMVALFARSVGLIARHRPARWRGRDVPAG